MIIRRRHTANFTVITNDVFNDQRLSLDEKGALGWFLSRPHDWHVNKRGCMSNWKCGRDKVNRIFRQLLKIGWARRNVLRGSDGTILGVEFVICDEPGKELSAADVASQFTEDDDTSEHRESAMSTPETPVAAVQQTPYPSTAEPSTGEPSSVKASAVLSIESNKTTDSEPPFPPVPSGSDPPSQKPTVGEGKQGSSMGASGYPMPSFEDFWTVWIKENPDSTQSEFTAEKLWVKLTDQQKRDAKAGISGYFAECHRRKHKILCHAKVYLRERRWRGFIGASATVKPQWYECKPYTPQWYRWRDYKLAAGERVAFMETRARQGQMYLFPSEWPPPIGSTGPPVAA